MDIEEEDVGTDTNKSTYTTATSGRKRGEQGKKRKKKDGEMETSLKEDKKKEKGFGCFVPNTNEAIGGRGGWRRKRTAEKDTWPNVLQI